MVSNEFFIGESVPQMKEALENVAFSENAKFDEVDQKNN